MGKIRVHLFYPNCSVIAPLCINWRRTLRQSPLLKTGGKRKMGLEETVKKIFILRLV